MWFVNHPWEFFASIVCYCVYTFENMMPNFLEKHSHFEKWCRLPARSKNSTLQHMLQRWNESGRDFLRNGFSIVDFCDLFNSQWGLMCVACVRKSLFSVQMARWGCFFSFCNLSSLVGRYRNITIEAKGLRVNEAVLNRNRKWTRTASHS